MIFKSMSKELTNLQEADWVREMRQYFRQHGTYRAEDLNRLLGNPIKGVVVNSDTLKMSDIYFGQLDKGQSLNHNPCCDSKKLKK